MLDIIIQYFNAIIDQIGVVEQRYCLAQVVEKGETSIILANIGETNEPVTDIDKFNGVSWWMLDGDVATSEIDGPNIYPDIEKSFNLDLYVIINNNSNNSNLSGEALANSIIKNFSHNEKLLRRSIKARKLDIVADGYTTERSNILEDIKPAKLNLDGVALKIGFKIKCSFAKGCLEDLCDPLPPLQIGGGGSGEPINVTVNLEPFLTSVDVDSNISVQNTDGTEKGSRVGNNWVIPDSTVTDQDSNVLGTTPAGEDLQITVPETGYNITTNGDAFGTATAPNAFDVQIHDENGDDTGSKIGNAFVIPSASVVTASGSTIETGIIPGEAREVGVVVDFTVSDTTPFTQAEVTFTADQSLAAYELFWDFGDGNIATGQVVTHAYEAVGAKTPTLYVMGVDGFTGFEEKPDHISVSVDNVYYLLDNFNGCLLSASTKKMKSGTTDPLYSLVRDSDNATADFYANAAGELALDSLNTVGATLATWAGNAEIWLEEDLNEGTANTNFAQSIVSRRPKVMENGALIKSGVHPTFRTNASELVSGSVSCSSRRSYFIVAQEMGAGGSSYSNWMNQKATPFHQLYGNFGSALNYFNGTNYNAGILPDGNALAVHSIFQGGSEGVGYLNGVQQNTWAGISANTLTSPFQFAYLAGTTWANLKAATVLIFQDLDKATHQAIDAQLKIMYGI